MKSIHKIGVVGLAIAFGLPMAASAQQYDVRQYDGYCYAKKKDAQRNGTIIGAVIGGLVGSQVSKHERGLGTVGGAVIGGAIGNSAGKSSVKCYNGEYYSYQGAYYDPAPPPAGYSVVYYKERPPQGYYQKVYYDRYHHERPGPWGYSNDAWRHDDQNPNGWRDKNGYWHDGWRDSNGRWHERR
ncbi:hypothetical protein AEAC466_15375 [Asticcacaulis sp. AC466]|uniref:glycine zipper 2TM domain-containing protein n=1 Tax=Asticcacaulis sp. AC466 TaxID=1282362 RepID=UPI0003C3F610|nr:glycine zipper 2TM domain-containing protein [Asticcacaulis sp. AC466]ESQ82889.1 hypothetical protein AEAC466_15375 [Asticcacaulis sp. AC466]